MRRITFVSGLYSGTVNGAEKYPHKTIDEIKQSIAYNSWYKDHLVCYADSKLTGNILLKHGCNLHRIFDDAPPEIKHNAAHKMKHWIMLNAVKEFGDVIWLDWDTYNLRTLDNNFFGHCFRCSNPKFTFIENYWATVNCSVYYLNRDSVELMERSFYSVVEVPNDELLWKPVLPKDIVNRDEYWLKDMVINIWTEKDFVRVNHHTYFLHLKDFEMLKSSQCPKEVFKRYELAKH